MSHATKTPSPELVKKDKTMFKDRLSKLPQYQKDCVDKKGTAFTIRTVKLKDMEQVINLEYHMEIEDYGLDPSYLKIKTEIKTSLENSNPIMLVAEQDNKIVAFIWGYDVSKTMYPVLDNYLTSHSHAHINCLDQMVVDHNYRERGIAGILMDCYKEIAEKSGVNELVLKTINPTARRLYEKKHYTPIIDPVSNEEVLEPREKGGRYHYLRLEIK